MVQQSGNLATKDKLQARDYDPANDVMPLPTLRPSFALCVQRIVDHMNEHMKGARLPSILDIGCGRRSDLGKYLRENHYQATLHGADLDTNAQKNEDLDRLFLCDVADMPFQDGSYDIVFSQFLLEHVEDSQRAISSIARVTASGGLATLIIPNPTAPAAWITKLTPYSFHVFFKRRIQGFYNASADTFPTTFDFKTIKTLQQQMSDAGFTAIAIDYVPEIYYRFRLRPGLIHLAMAYTKVLQWLNLEVLMSSVVVSGIKASPTDS
ncbi:MAG: methyltransferase domain-containing protein [Cyanobacteria bacterium J06649_4]